MTTNKRDVLDSIQRLTEHINTMINTVRELKKIAKHLPDDIGIPVEKKLCKGVCSSGKKCCTLTENINGYCNQHTRQVPSWQSVQYLEAIKLLKERPYTHNHGDVDVFYDDCAGCRKKQNDDLMKSLDPEYTD